MADKEIGSLYYKLDIKGARRAKVTFKQIEDSQKRILKNGVLVNKVFKARLSTQKKVNKEKNKEAYSWKKTSSVVKDVLKSENKRLSTTKKENRALNEQLNIFKKMAVASKKIMGFGVRKTGGFLGKGGRGVLSVGAAGLFGNSSGVVARGVLTGNVLAAIAGGITNRIIETLNYALNVEKGVMNTQLGLWLGNRYTQERDRRFRRIAKGLSFQYGVPQDVLQIYAGQGLAGGMDPKKMERVMKQAVRLAIATSKPLDTIMMQIVKAVNSGYLDETILSVVPALKQFQTTDEVRKNALPVIEQQLSRFEGFEDKSTRRQIEKFIIRINHFMMEAFQPAIKGYRTYLRKANAAIDVLMGGRRKFTRLTTVLGSFFARGTSIGKTLPSLLEKLDKIFAIMLRVFLRGGIDFFDFLTGDKPEDSVLGQVLQKAGFENSILGLIKWFFSEISAAIIKAFMAAWNNIKQGSNENGLVDPDLVKDIQTGREWMGLYRSLKENLGFENNPMEEEMNKVNGIGKKTKGDQSSVIINNQFDINSSAPHQIIRESIIRELIPYSNQEMIS